MQLKSVHVRRRTSAQVVFKNQPAIVHLLRLMQSSCDQKEKGI